MKKTVMVIGLPLVVFLLAIPASAHDPSQTPRQDLLHIHIKGQITDVDGNAITGAKVALVPAMIDRLFSGVSPGTCRIEFISYGSGGPLLPRPQAGQGYIAGPSYEIVVYLQQPWGGCQALMDRPDLAVNPDAIRITKAGYTFSPKGR
jgi:hypothetical protein